MATTTPKPRSPTPDTAAPGRAAPTAWLFHGVTAVALTLLLLTLVLGAARAPFPGRLTGIGLFLAAALERFWAMYLRPGVRHVGGGAARDWSALAVGYAYTLTMALAGLEFVARRRGLPGVALLAVGGGLYGLGVAGRYWAFAALRQQWHVDVTDVSGERHLVRSGPYRWVRHPLYAGACLEAAGLPLLLGAPVALGFGLLVFVPLEVMRAYYEERFLRTLFGAAYTRYADEVPGFVPRLLARARPPAEPSA